MSDEQHTSRIKNTYFVKVEGNSIVYSGSSEDDARKVFMLICGLTQIPGCSFRGKSVKILDLNYSVLENFGG